MKKYLLISSILLISFSLKAQQIVKPIDMKGKTVYTSLFNSNELIKVGSVHLSQEQIATTHNLEDRMALFISNASAYDYDVLMTRDGNTAILKKYKTTAASMDEVVKINSHDKAIFFLSQPDKEYKAVKTKRLTKEEMHQAFHQIITHAIHNEKELVYDALVIESDEVKYIVYK